jgi:hypothetical protein
MTPLPPIPFEERALRTSVRMRRARIGIVPGAFASGSAQGVECRDYV